MKFGAIAAWSFAMLLLAVARVSMAGRPVEIWATDRLWREADVVVIAVAETSESHNLSGEKSNAWVPVRTTFAVEAVLKGKGIRKRLILHHYRYQNKRAEIEVIDGPAFVAFDGRGKASYLMFLKATAEHEGDAPELEPLTGQMDPGDSFRRLVPVER